jgi:zinc/manganese transport system substrate-binding protein
VRRRLLSAVADLCATRLAADDGAPPAFAALIFAVFFSRSLIMNGFRFLSLIAAMFLLVNSAGAADKLPVVASFSILGDVVSQVGGDRVSVSTLVGPDADAHVFQPSPSDAKAIAGAKLVVVNGLGFEGWIDRLVRNANYRGQVVVASQDIKARHLPGDDRNKIDPHAWQDPSNVEIYVRNIADGLSRLDPSGAPVYQRNATRYLQELTQLDAWAAAQFATIPAKKRIVITSHDAFGYFGAHYGIRFLAPQGISTESEASAMDVAKLVRQIKLARIRAVYMENMTNPALIEQLARETGVTLGAPLYADALSGPQGKAPNYIEMVRYNVTQLMTGLKQN